MISDPAKGSKKNGFSTGFDHSNEVSFETNSTHSHDDEELESCLRGEKKLLLTPKEVRTVVSREARMK